jgi:hypothetical protein
MLTDKRLEYCTAGAPLQGSGATKWRMQADKHGISGVFRLDNAQVRVKAQRTVEPEAVRLSDLLGVPSGTPRGCASRLLRVVTIPETRNGLGVMLRVAPPPEKAVGQGGCALRRRAKLNRASRAARTCP